jgi:hypothetical protein
MFNEPVWLGQYTVYRLDDLRTKVQFMEVAEIFLSTVSRPAQGGQLLANGNLGQFLVV